MYVLRSESDSGFYIGFSTNLRARLRQHHDGESFAKDLLYAPLPAEIAKRVEGKINSITSGGKPLK